MQICLIQPVCLCKCSLVLKLNQPAKGIFPLYQFLPYSIICLSQPALHFACRDRKSILMKLFFITISPNKSQSMTLNRHHLRQCDEPSLDATATEVFWWLWIGLISNGAQCWLAIAISPARSNWDIVRKLPHNIFPLGGTFVRLKLCRNVKVITNWLKYQSAETAICCYCCLI